MQLHSSTAVDNRCRTAGVHSQAMAGGRTCLSSSSLSNLDCSLITSWVVEGELDTYCIHAWPPVDGTQHRSPAPDARNGATEMQRTVFKLARRCDRINHLGFECRTARSTLTLQRESAITRTVAAATAIGQSVIGPGRTWFLPCDPLLCHFAGLNPFLRCKPARAAHRSGQVSLLVQMTPRRPSAAAAAPLSWSAAAGGRSARAGRRQRPRPGSTSPATGPAARPLVLPATFRGTYLY